MSVNGGRADDEKAEVLLAAILDEANEMTCASTGVIEKRMNPTKLRNLLRTKFARISALAHTIHERPESLIERIDRALLDYPRSATEEVLREARDELKKRGAS